MRETSDTGWLIARPIAHRGYHDAASGRIENTLPAFEAAIARNFAIECDVRETSDGQVVVFHDDTLARLTETPGEVAGLSLAEVRAARFRGSDAHVPTLDEALDLVDGRVPLFVELKTGVANSERLARAVAAALATYEGQVAVMSFTPEALTATRTYAPQLVRGMIVDGFSRSDYPQLSPLARFALRHLFAAPFVLPRFVACAVECLPASAPLALHHFFELPLLTWTIRNPSERKLARVWADQIIFEGFDPDA